MSPDIIQGFNFISHLSYVGIFLAVAFSGYVIPIPEEFVLVTAGFIAAQGIINLPIIFLICVVGAVFGDTLVFYLSGHGSRFTKKYHKKVESTHVGWYVRHMKKNTGVTVFLSRFIPGMRLMSTLVAGLLKKPMDVFVIATALSASIYIPLVVLIGYHFNNKIYLILGIVRSVRHSVVLLFAAGALFLLFLFIKNLLEEGSGS